MWKCSLILVIVAITFTYSEEDAARDGRAVSAKNFFGGVWGNRPPLLDKNLPKATCTCKCGERNEVSRIVGGTEANNDEFPWIAKLIYFKRFYCGGMLINDRYVLTAAHCVKGFMWFMIKVTFGEHNRCNATVRPETRFVIRVIANKFSLTNFDHDIALLRLNERMHMSDAIKPICLPTDKYVATSLESRFLEIVERLITSGDSVWSGVAVMLSLGSSVGRNQMEHSGKVAWRHSEEKGPVVDNHEVAERQGTTPCTNSSMV